MLFSSCSRAESIISQLENKTEKKQKKKKNDFFSLNKEMKFSNFPLLNVG